MNFIRILLLLVVGISVGKTTIAQSENEIYSLLTQLRVAQHDTTKMDIYLSLADSYIGEDVDKALNNANLAVILSSNLKDEHRLLLAYEQMMRIYFEIKYDLPKSLEYLEKAKAIDTTATTVQDRANLLGYEGRIFLAVNDFENAQEAFFEQLQTYRKLNDRAGVAQVNYHLGTLWYERRDYEQALLHYSNALTTYVELHDAEGRIHTLNKLGQTYGALRDYDHSLQFSLEALSLAQQLSDDFLQTSINANLGTAYLNLGNLGNALKYYRVALEYGEELENERLIAQIANKLGDTYHGLCNEPKAAQYYKRALDLAEDIDNKNVRKEVYQSLYEYHDEYSRHDMAYLYLKKLTQIKEELYNEERTRQFINNQIRYQTATKEEENKRLKANELENKVIISNQRIQNYVLVFFIFIVLLATYFLYNAFKQKKEYNKVLKEEVKKQTLSLEKSNQELLTSNQQLEQSNNELERFAYIASHDLKSPLRNIISFLNLIQRKMRKYDDEDLKEYLRFATDSAKQMNQLIADVLEFSRIQNAESEKQSVDLNESLILVMKNVQDMMEEKQATVETQALPVIEGNSVHILQLFQNLIANGIKYNKNPNPQVSIQHRSEKDHYLFSIADNGIGIEPEFHDKIFQMFKRLHTGEEYSGTGIGLAICKKIIQNLNGKIWLESTPGQGTTFYFTIPNGQTP